jgi:hypothetical protein
MSSMGMKSHNAEANTSSALHVIRTGSDSTPYCRRLGWCGLLIATGLCLFVLWTSGVPNHVLHFGGAKDQIEYPGFVATKYTYRSLEVPPEATPKERLIIYYLNARGRLWRKKPDVVPFVPTQVHAYNVEALLNDCTESSGKRYLIAREALGVVYFGHTNSLNAKQWVAQAEQVLRDRGLVLLSNRAGLVKVIPKANLPEYRKAGLLKDTDGP